jgi:hypothetical protein
MAGSGYVELTGYAPNVGSGGRGGRGGGAGWIWCRLCSREVMTTGEKRVPPVRRMQPFEQEVD